MKNKFLIFIFIFFIINLTRATQLCCNVIDELKKQCKEQESSYSISIFLSEKNIDDLLLTEILETIESLDISNKITFLNLDKNKIITIPPEIEKLTALEYLFLNVNQISIIPPEIATLSKLEFIDLSNNLISEVPKEITKPPKLKYVYIEGNKITEIQSDILEFFEKHEALLYW